MRRKFISLTLVLCILLSCFAIGGISASAATATDEVGTISGGQTIYFTPSNNWKQDGARFALYYFNDSTGTNGWVNGTTESNTIYKMTIPSGTWTGIIFVRMNPSSSQNNWNNKWNQTADITSIPSGKNHYFLNEGWDNPSGYWGTHTPATQPTTAAPTTVQPTTVQPTTVQPTTTVAPTTENTGLGSYTVYFIDTQNWGTPNLYFWNAGPSWPGTEMTQTGVDSNGKKIYSMTIPSETVGIVFNANGNQTVDITTNICDGATWYATGAKDGSKFVVDYIAPQEPTTEPTTAAPQYTQTVYFKPNAEWRSNNAVFAINVWGKSRWTEAWVQLNPIGNGYYYAELPGIAEGYNIAVAWESCQFARFSYGTTSFSADNALSVSTSRVFYNNHLYTLDDIMMDNVTGSWSDYEGNTVVPDTTGNTSTVYFKPGTDWERDNAKFAIYVWGKGSWASAWVELDYLADGIYYAKLPSIDENYHIGVAWESCQFARFSPETTQYSSSNAWNISMAKVFERGKLFTLNAGEWNDAGGTWSTYGEQPTTVAPTTVEPTTAAPATVEPTTVAPTTVAPTTVEPTTAPEGATVKVVVPDSYLQNYKWDSVNLYYTNSSTYANADTIAMTKTNDVYYVNNTNANIASVVNASGWSVYSVSLTPAQATAIDNAKIVGFASGNKKNRTQFGNASNVFKAGVGEYTAYGTTKANVASLDGYTFVICDARSSSSPYTSYVGYWTSDYTTVKFAAPAADTQRSTWDAVNFCYGANVSTSTDVAMVNTKETTKITDVGNMSTLKPGRWFIYAITLDAAQTEAANGSAYVGFKKPNADNKTAASKNVLKAYTNDFVGTYGEYSSTARTLQDLEGQLFVVKSRATASSLMNFNGEWETENVYTAHNDETVTIYFAAPTGADGTSAGWDSGVQLYYNTNTDYKSATRINMTPVDATTAVTTNLPTLKTGDWAVYAVELDADDISAIDSVNYVGFIKTGSYNRTSILYTKNITKASKTEDHTYSTKKQTIEAFDGYTFVIDSCADAKNERTSYTGAWVDTGYYNLPFSDIETGSCSFNMDLTSLENTTTLYDIIVSSLPIEDDKVYDIVDGTWFFYTTHYNGDGNYSSDCINGARYASQIVSPGTYYLALTAYESGNMDNEVRASWGTITLTQDAYVQFVFNPTAGTMSYTIDYNVINDVIAC